MASTTPLFRGLPFGRLDEPGEPEEGRGRSCRIPKSVPSAVKPVVGRSVDDEVWYGSERDGTERCVDVPIRLFVVGGGVWTVVVTANSVGVVVVKSRDSWVRNRGKVV